MKSKLIGKRVIVTDTGSIYYDEWGTIADVDEDGFYYVAIANEYNSLPIFDRNQFKIPRKQEF